jgi:hypothetical protein
VRGEVDVGDFLRWEVWGCMGDDGEDACCGEVGGDVGCMGDDGEDACCGEVGGDVEGDGVGPWEGLGVGL